MCLFEFGMGVNLRKAKVVLVMFGGFGRIMEVDPNDLSLDT